jgi:hypothetical protein
MIRLSVLCMLVWLGMSSAAQAQTTVVKVSPDRNTVTATNDKGTATTTIQRDGHGGATLTTRYQPNNGYKAMGSSGSYNPMGQKR